MAKLYTEIPLSTNTPGLSKVLLKNAVQGNQIRLIRNDSLNQSLRKIRLLVSANPLSNNRPQVTVKQPLASFFKKLFIHPFKALKKAFKAFTKPLIIRLLTFKFNPLNGNPLCTFSRVTPRNFKLS